MEFPPNYKIIKTLGSGASGTVYQAEDPSGTTVAIKCIAFHNDKILRYIMQEIDIMKKIKNPGVIHLYDVHKSATHVNLILEYCAGGNLEEFIQAHGPLPLTIVKKWCKSILQTFADLEKSNIMHRDVKPANFCLTSTSIDQAELKISDFGFARFLNNKLAFSKIGTPLYMAPEIFHSDRYNFKADVWSLGLVIYEMLEGHCAYDCFTLVDLLELQKRPITFTQLTLIDAQEMIMAMVEYDMVKRSSFEQLLKFTFFAEYEIINYALEESFIHLESNLSNRSSIYINTLEADRNIKDIQSVIAIILDLNRNAFSVNIALCKYCIKIIGDLSQKIRCMPDLSERHKITFQEELVQYASSVEDISRELDINESIIEEHAKEAILNKLIQLLFDYSESDRFLLIGAAIWLDPTSTFLSECYEIIYSAN